MLVVRTALVLLVLGSFMLPRAARAQSSYQLFDSGHVRPVALSPDGSQLFAINSPDGYLEVFDLGGSGLLHHVASVPVGLEPVAVVARTNDEVWVVNHLSDSVSIVRLDGSGPRVIRTLHVGDEPNDIVFGGSGGNRAFISTAHRGQNSPNDGLDYATSGIGRADVWVFDALSLGTDLGGSELTIITLFGDKPRALAVSPDGATVYAAIFHSGNRTTALSDGVLCDASASEISMNSVVASCTLGSISPPGGYPPPHVNHEPITRPETGLIVKQDRDGLNPTKWLDELGVDWTPFVKFDLPDEDVFKIDANANPPVQTGSAFTGVGTVLFNMAVNPQSPFRVYVSNTDAQNHVRFEGPGTFASGSNPKDPSSPDSNTVRGDLARSQITILDGATVTPRHLNSHIPYGTAPVPAGVKEKSLATPMGMVVSPDGNTLYVAAFGSQEIGVIDTAALEAGTYTPSASDHIALSGGGPSGLVLDAAGDRLYALTRFNNSVVVIDTSVSIPIEIQALSLHSPEPIDVIDGRPLLYDAKLTGSNGEASCSSCHIFGDLDSLAWDLGDPDGTQVANTNPFVPGTIDLLPAKVFHPMKGPMTTQSLRGLKNAGPQHWRGDRQGDEIMGFEAFLAAFDGLVGRDASDPDGGPVSFSQMTAFRKFALELRYPPNPIRKLDNSFRTDEATGLGTYNNTVSDGNTCNACHGLDPANGHFGTQGESTFEGETQHFKVAHLRNAYQKIGMFGIARSQFEIPVPPAPEPGSFIDQFGGSFGHTGDQIRGFGFLHDGSIDTLARFLSTVAFTTSLTQELEMEALIMAFPTDMAPIVGQQVTLTATSSAAVTTRIAELILQSDTSFISKEMGGTVTECELIARLRDGSVETGYLHQGSGMFLPDNGGSVITDAALQSKASVAGQEITYSCMPPGSGPRTALDRDEDDLDNGFETNTGVFVSASDTGTNPGLADSDGDGFDDGYEVHAGSDPNDPLSLPGAVVPALSTWGLSLLALVVALGGVLESRRRWNNE